MTLPQPSGDFEWVQAPWGAALQCRPLAAVVPHCFTTKDLPLADVGDERRNGWDELAASLGIDPGGLVRLRQVHGAAVYSPVRGSESGLSPEADIAITDDPCLAVSIRSADCVPILLAVRNGRAVAAVHAGWKGTAEGAAGVAVRALTERFGAHPADIIAAVGPSIGPCCYEVGPELPPRFSRHPEAEGWFSSEARPRLDLWRATHDQLRRAGVSPDQIHVARLCTFDYPALFHSYRRDASGAGRLVAAIRSAPNTTP